MTWSWPRNSNTLVSTNSDVRFVPTKKNIKEINQVLWTHLEAQQGGGRAVPPEADQIADRLLARWRDQPPGGSRNLALRVLMTKYPWR